MQAAKRSLTVNLRDWLLYGDLGDRMLPQAELAHIQAALAGDPSPKDGLYSGRSSSSTLMRSFGSSARLVLGQVMPATRSSVTVTSESGTSPAALLNAAHPGVAYPRTVAEVVADVNAALLRNHRSEMLALAAALDHDNNLGCTLD